MFDLKGNNDKFPTFVNKGTNIGIGEYYVGTAPMTAIGLGSCVALILHDTRLQIGGLAHVMLPGSNGNRERPGKFADTAVPVLLEELIAQGSNKRSIVAKMAGGACMFRNFKGNLNIGERNIIALRDILTLNRIPIETEDTGGTLGRSIIYHPADLGRLILKRSDGTCIEI